jgi:hypothetical protein
MMRVRGSCLDLILYAVAIVLLIPLLLHLVEIVMEWARAID